METSSARAAMLSFELSAKVLFTNKQKLIRKTNSAGKAMNWNPAYAVVIYVILADGHARAV